MSKFMKSIVLYRENIIRLMVVSISIFGLLAYSTVNVFALASPTPLPTQSSPSSSSPSYSPSSTSSQGSLSNSSKETDINDSTIEDLLSPKTITESQSPPKQISLSGTITSKNDPVQVTGLEQSYYILPVENNSKIYSGIITFTSSKPVLLQSINILTLNNTLKLPIQFGTLYTFPLNNTIMITSDLFDVPRVTGSVMFAGNSLRFITNEPFLLTYSFNGQQSEAVVKNDIESGLETYRKLIGTIS